MPEWLWAARLEQPTVSVSNFGSCDSRDRARQLQQQKRRAEALACVAVSAAAGAGRGGAVFIGMDGEMLVENPAHVGRHSRGRRVGGGHGGRGMLLSPLILSFPSVGLWCFGVPGFVCKGAQHVLAAVYVF